MEFKPENTEVFCLVCQEAYSNSKPGEQWIQCMDWGNWSHFDCTGVSANENIIFVTAVCQIKQRH